MTDLPSVQVQIRHRHEASCRLQGIERDGKIRESSESEV